MVPASVAGILSGMPTMPINGVELAYDEAGSGPPLLLLHAGIADRRMWDDVLPLLSERFRVIRPDLRGYGETPLPDGPFVYAADAAELLRALGIARAHVVGVSMGGSVAVDLALAHPELVDHLVLVGAGLPGWEFGDAMNTYDEAETAALERGDLDEASWLNVRFWLDGATRGEDALDPTLRQRVFGMTRLGFSWENEKAEGGWLVADRRSRMGEITASTLVLVGELDQPDFVDIADAIAALIPGARVQRLAGVAHLPPMEEPAGFVAAVVPFLEG